MHSLPGEKKPHQFKVYFEKMKNRLALITHREVSLNKSKSKVEDKPRYTECQDHGTAWHQGPISPHMMQLYLGSHTASYYHCPPSQEMPRANLH